MFVCAESVVCCCHRAALRLSSAWRRAGNSLCVHVQFALQRGLMLELYSAGRCGDEGVLLMLGALLRLWFKPESSSIVMQLLNARVLLRCAAVVRALIQVSCYVTVTHADAHIVKASGVTCAEATKTYSHSLTVPA